MTDINMKDTIKWEKLHYELLKCIHKHGIKSKEDESNIYPILLAISKTIAALTLVSNQKNINDTVNFTCNMAKNLFEVMSDNNGVGISRE